jgi:hypothetical protein
MARAPQIALLFGWLFIAAWAQVANAQSPTGKWLAEQDPQWQTTFKNDVLGAFDKAQADLKKQYAASLEAQLAAAARDGKLDDAVAIRSERDRVAAGNVPPDDDPSVLASLRTLRAGYAKSLATLTADRAARGKALYERYDGILAQNQTSLTKAQRLDEALEVKARRDQLKTEWLDKIVVAAPALAARVPPAGVPPSATPATATPSPATPKPLPIVTAVRPADRAEFYICGSNGITLYINNKEIIADVRREKVATVRANIREGDTLIVRNADRWDINSTWIAAYSTKGEFLFETGMKWTGYMPASEPKWWILKGNKGQMPVEFAPDKQEYVDLVKKSMRESSLNREAQPIRSPLHIEGSRATYLHYTVTREDLLPKAGPPASTK